jgi:hypothetical protein
MSLNKTHLVHLAMLISIALAFYGCKTKEEPLPEVKLSVSSALIFEGDTIQFINESKNSNYYVWKIPALNFTSNEVSPKYTFRLAGKYELYLKARNGDGQEAEKILNIEVLPDSVYRLSNHGKKLWMVKSIIYSGSEVLTQSCQKDDEFTVYYGQSDTCVLTEGKNKCSAGTYIFDLPATSAWRFNSKKKAFEFSLTAFGSPIALSFVATELTHTSFKGKDALNDVSITLEAAP